MAAHHYFILWRKILPGGGGGVGGRGGERDCLFSLEVQNNDVCFGLTFKYAL